ncbi:uncharacterized protein PgNI_01175 [Pyricularia grisea]|uniref:Uncharacterized protein n=1 Tax=Pyricularia grisea TaxID=148305 RepID=A0A6P8BJJ5_PYRGI|nr:uncharacterized protein PgNI_01175 [Pyricularia grisea]TLD16747.1 hypothetical protein PgNI_01175 [Pyricularia grisea]
MPYHSVQEDDVPVATGFPDDDSSKSLPGRKEVEVYPWIKRYVTCPVVSSLATRTKRDADEIAAAARSSDPASSPTDSANRKRKAEEVDDDAADSKRVQTKEALSSSTSRTSSRSSSAEISTPIHQHATLSENSIFKVITLSPAPVRKGSRDAVERDVAAQSLFLLSNGALPSPTTKPESLGEMSLKGFPADFQPPYRQQRKCTLPSIHELFAKIPDDGFTSSDFRPRDWPAWDRRNSSASLASSTPPSLCADSPLSQSFSTTFATTPPTQFSAPPPRPVRSFSERSSLSSPGLPPLVINTTRFALAMTPEVYQAASARSSRRCSPSLVTKQPTIRKRAKRGKKERTGEYSADESSPTTATSTLSSSSSSGHMSELGGGGHPNQKYPMAHEHFVIYARKKHDKRTTWKDVTTAFNKAIGPVGPQNPGLDMYVTQPERSLNLPAQREQAGVTSMYYRTNKVIPVMDGRGGLVYGDDGEPLLEWIHERDTSRSPPGLIERYPEIVLDRDYWFVSDEDKRWAAHLKAIRDQQRRERGLPTWDEQHAQAAGEQPRDYVPRL